MKKILASLFLALAAVPALATFPQDDYHNYLIVLVHGLGGDTNIIGTYAYPKHTGWLKPANYFNKPGYLSVIKQASDNTEDHADGLF
jgi:tetrahydromethanopterin S-methyltransferase subunit E